MCILLLLLLLSISSNRSHTSRSGNSSISCCWWWCCMCSCAWLMKVHKSKDNFESLFSPYILFFQVEYNLLFLTCYVLCSRIAGMPVYRQYSYLFFISLWECVSSCVWLALAFYMELRNLIQAPRLEHTAYVCS